MTAWDSVTGSPCPPYSAGADRPSQPPSATCLKASLKPFGVVTRPSSWRMQPSRSPTRLSGCSTSSAEFCGFVQDRLAHVGGGVAEAGKIVVAIDLKHVVEQETDVFQGGFVARHGFLVRRGWRRPFRGDFAAQQSISSRIDLRRNRQPSAVRRCPCDNVTARPRGLAVRSAIRAAPGNFRDRPPDSLTPYLP